MITGWNDAVEKAAERLKAAGAKRILPLKVSGPFHSPLLKEAGKELGEELKSVELSELQIPYVTNVTAEYVSEIDQTKAASCKAGGGIGQMAAEYRKNAQSGCRYFYRDRSGKNTDRIYEKDQQRSSDI